MRDDYERLLDIQEAIQNVEKYGAQGKTAFEREELIQTWIVYYLQILGEAASNLSDKLKNRHTGVPWKKITGMRNILVHGYFDIDLDIVWRLVEENLPDLKQAVERILEAEKPAPDTRQQ